MNRYLRLFLLFFCSAVIVSAIVWVQTGAAEEGSDFPSVQSEDSQKNQESVLVTSYYEWVQALKKRDTITRMTLYGNSITDEDLSQLRLFSNLESLNFEGRINRNTVANFMSIPQLKELTLFLDQCSQPSAVAALAEIKNLKKLSLIGNNYFSVGGEKWGTEDFAFIQALPQLESLEMVLGLASLKSDLDFSFLDNLTELENLSIAILDSEFETELTIDEGFAEKNSPSSEQESDDSAQVEYVFDFDDTQLNHLKNKTKLKSLSLICGSFTDAGLNIISNFPLLETLCVKSDNVTGDFFALFSQTPKLKELDVAGCKNLFPVSLEKLSVLENLEKLDLSSCNSINNAGIQCLRHLSKLKKLDISNLPLVSDEGITALEELMMLESLTMRHTRCSFKAFYSINKIKTLKNLHAIKFNSSDANAAFPQPQAAEEEEETKYASTFDFNYISELNNLEAIALEGDGILISLENFMEYLHCFPKLKELDLTQFSFIGDEDEDSNNKIYDSDLEIISCLTDLEKLDLSGYASVTSEGVKHLSRLKKLKNLILANCDIDDAAAGEIGKITSLENLILSRDSFFNDLIAQQGGSAGLSDDGLKYIGALTNLQALFLFGNEAISNEGLKHLANLDKLECLWLDSPYMNNDCLKYVAEMESLKMFVNYSGTFTCQGVEVFKNHDKIESLDLGITWDTDEKLKYLPCIRQCSSVELSGAAVTDSGVASLASMPYLSQLFLDECSEVTGSGFASGFDKSSIHRINFFGCNSLTREGLSQLKNLPRLRHILFKNSDLLTDDVLLGLKHCVQLDEIEVSDCRKVTGSFMDELSKALPDCHIHQNEENE